MAEGGLDDEGARSLLEVAGDDLSVALVMNKTGSTRVAAAAALQLSDWVVAHAIESLSEKA